MQNRMQNNCVQFFVWKELTVEQLAYLHCSQVFVKKAGEWMNQLTFDGLTIQFLTLSWAPTGLEWFFGNWDREFGYASDCFLFAGLLIANCFFDFCKNVVFLFFDDLR